MSIERLKKDIVELGKLGRPNQVAVETYEELDMEKGLWRLEGNDLSIKSKEYIVNKMKEAGLEVRFDRVGNIFGRKPGSNANKKAIMAGSHLDSVKNGGQFDGPLGIVTALEAIRTLNDEKYPNERPIELVVFMGEEGSAFPQGLLGSEVLVGNKPVDEALQMKNEEGVILYDALGSYRGDFEMDLGNVEYFIELHPEQGPVLDQEKVSIGIVESITGITWVKAVIQGEENHAGTTPMHMRRDPLVASSEIVLLANNRAKEMAKAKNASTVATVGKLEVHPSAPNIIPGEVELGIDIRDGVDENIKNLRAEIISYIQKLEDNYGFTTTVEILFHKPPALCSPEVVSIIEEAAEKNSIKAKRMNSGAGHDAQNLAGKVKTAMIFVPSVNGISHSPMEWSNWEDIEKGLTVLIQVFKDV